MGQKVASLEIELAMATGGAVADLNRFGGVVDKVSANAIRDLDRIDAQMKNVGGLDVATASAVRFAEQTAKSAVAAARELNRIEKSGEAMAAQLDRQLSVFGKTTSEVRALKAETAALAAEQAGASELAGRIRAKEARLYDLEFAAARRARIEAETAAEQRLADAAAAEREAQAIREAAAAHAIFEAKVRQGVTAMREAEAAQKAADKGAEAERVRKAANAYQMFEAAARRGAAAMREVETAARNDAMEMEAARLRSAAAAFQMFEARAREGAAAMRDADAAAAEFERMIARVASRADPAAVAMGRLKTELDEAKRAFDAGRLSADLFQQEQARIAGAAGKIYGPQRQVTEAIGGMGKAAKLSSGDMLNLGYQINDIVVSLASGQKPFMVFAQQGAQIGQIAASSGVGLAGMARAVGALLLPFAPLIGTLGVAAAGMALFSRAVSEGVDTKAMVNSLGLTHAEIKRLKDVSVDTGDVVTATFQVLAQRIGIDLSNAKSFFSDAMDYMTTLGRQTLAALYSEFVGTFDAIGRIVKGVFDGKSIGDILKDAGGAYREAFDAADGAMKRFGADVTKQIGANKLSDLQKQANEIKADRTPKVDHHAEQLAREAAATEAQIRNLYALAEAYGVSGGAALVAEARAKAESAAIKKRGDIEEFVARQIRLMTAQRVADAAKGIADMRDQAAIQEQVNAAVAAGITPSRQAADLMRDRIADLPLLAAMEAARIVGDVKGATAAAEALDEQRAARDRLTDAERQASLLAASQAGADQLDMLREEARLIGATDAVRIRALATLRAEQEVRANGWGGAKAAQYVEDQVKIALGQDEIAKAQERFNNLLPESEDAVKRYAAAFTGAFGGIGDAVARATAALIDHGAEQRRIADLAREKRAAAAGDAVKLAAIEKETARATAQNQIGAYADVTGAAKSMFSEQSRIYKALQAAETVFRAVQLAMSIQKMVQDAAETASAVANSGIRAAAAGTEGIATQAKLPFPANIAAMAATAAALVGIGVAVAGSVFGGGKNTLEKANEGRGTVLGDSDAQSASIKNAIDQLREIDDVTLTVNRQMLGSLRSIESNIGGLASLLVRTGNIDASAGVNTGFKTDALGSALALAPFGLLGEVAKKLPVVGEIVGAVQGVIKGLFGTKTSVVGSGLYGDEQTLGDILGGGFDASYYSDIKKKKKFFGISAGTSYKTQYADADGGIEDQFTLLLRQFYETIGQAAGPLGVSLDDVEGKLSGFVVKLGKIDLQGLTGAEIEEKLAAVFGAAADGMAEAALPGLDRFQKVGEGYYETLVRVASTVEAVDATFQMLGRTAGSMGVDVDMAIAGLFDSVGDFTDTAAAYFEAYYSDAEQAAAKTAHLSRVFGSLGVAMPGTLASFRALVDAQDLTSAAGREVYATLLQIAPAFADLQEALGGAKSAADILSERQDLERKLLELTGDTTAIRAAEIARLDPSNRALQTRIYALQDEQSAAKDAAEAARGVAAAEQSIAQERAGLTRQLLQLQGDTAALRQIELAGINESNRALQQQVYSLQDAQEASKAADAAAADAARAAEQLRDAWKSIGDSIVEEVRRIRGLNAERTGEGFAALQGRFNASSAAARAGDQTAAQTLPGLSQALLEAAGSVATSRQELARIEALTAASLEETLATIGAAGAPENAIAQWERLSTAQAAVSNDNTAALAAELRELRAEVTRFREENNAGNAAVAGNTNRSARVLENVSQQSGGDAIATVAA